MNKRIEFWDDERSSDNGIIVTLHYGWSFEYKNHDGVKGFDTVKEANQAVKDSYKCECSQCQR
jgi:hypothetical protein